MTDLEQIQVLVPEHVQDACDLPMGTLDAMSNHLSCDVVAAVRGEVPEKRYAAWAELAYQWARIAGVDKPKRETYRDYKVDEIGHALGFDREPPDPTEPNATSSDAPSASSSLTPSDASPTT